MNPETDQQRRERTIKLGVALGLAAILVVVVLIVVSQSGSSDSGTSAGGELGGLEQNGLTLGDPDAPVTIVEYGDLQCPICRAFARQEVPALIDDEVRPGDAKIEFRPWKIIGPDSQLAHEAALAAAEQNKLWEFVLAFYDQQQAENSGYVTDDFLTGIAEDAGLDVDKWQRDRENAAFDAELKKIDAEATVDGFTGTPSVLVEGPAGRVPFTGNAVPSVEEIEAAVVQVSGNQ